MATTTNEDEDDDDDDVDVESTSVQTSSSSSLSKTKMDRIETKSNDNNDDNSMKKKINKIIITSPSDDGFFDYYDDDQRQQQKQRPNRHDHQQQQQQQQKLRQQQQQSNENQLSLKHQQSSDHQHHHQQNNQFLQLDLSSKQRRRQQPNRIKMVKNSLGQLNRKQQQQPPSSPTKSLVMLTSNHSHSHPHPHHKSFVGPYSFSNDDNEMIREKQKKLIITNENDDIVDDYDVDDDDDNSICIEINDDDHQQHDSNKTLPSPQPKMINNKISKSNNNNSVFDNIFDSPVVIVENDQMISPSIAAKTNNEHQLQLIKQQSSNINHHKCKMNFNIDPIDNHYERYNQSTDDIMDNFTTPTSTFKFQMNNDDDEKNQYLQQQWSDFKESDHHQSSFDNSMNKKSPISMRTSILGKPLPTRKEVPYYRQRFLIYNLLQRPKGFWPQFYHRIVIIIIIIGLLLFALSTVDDYYLQTIQYLRIYDTFILALFIVEFLARAWSSSCISQYQGWLGLLRFCTSTFRLIDIFIILCASTVLYVHKIDPSISNQINWLRIAQAFQILRLSHRFKPWRIMASVIWNQRDHLTVAVYMCTLSLIFITFVVYFIEHNQPDTDFTSIPKTLWWGIVSLLTIGYGDMVPTTIAGKFTASILLLICFSSFALPAGILGTGLALEVQEQQRQKRFEKRRDPAAFLIQCAWRCYASSKNSRSIATWKVCLKKQQQHQQRRRYKLKNISQSNSDQQIETISSVVDLKCLRNKIHKHFGSESQSSLVDYSSRSSNTIDNNNESSGRSIQSLAIMATSPKIYQNKHRLLDHTTMPIIMNQNNDEYYCEYFTPAEKSMIRFIRLVKFEVARKNFKNALRPYDINDVIEQNAAGHADVIQRVKTMHSRINSIQNSLINVTKICQNLSEIQYQQIDRLERIIQELNQKLSIENSDYQSTTSSTKSTKTINKYLSVNDSSSSIDSSSIISIRSITPSTYISSSSSSSSPLATQSTLYSTINYDQSNDDHQQNDSKQKQAKISENNRRFSG
uniref:Potassium voltage-gated channel subfamily KQT member 2-like n=1 Tax=Dermatophagoides pteronyssinus TaxID=6956 RepID=A0A6P6Y663_DERPT|nr:potassium voltage-gated channel subfamily KQT member 2-like [Dermatophagoides pteronyssinus]